MRLWFLTRPSAKGCSVEPPHHTVSHCVTVSVVSADVLLYQPDDPFVFMEDYLMGTVVRAPLCQPTTLMLTHLWLSRTLLTCRLIALAIQNGETMPVTR